MKNHNQYVQWMLGCSAAVLMTACSGVQFSPTDVASKNSTDGGIHEEKMSESFFPNPADSKPMVDVLFVVDNSASMRDEQVKLSGRLSSFLSSLNNVNWQIGITTTDTSDSVHGIKGSLLQMTGTSSYILTKNTPNYEQVFANTVVRPEGVGCGANCPSRVERPLQALTMAFAKSNTVNSGFFRPGAELAVVIMSDADEGGDGQTPSLVTTPEEVLYAAQSQFGVEKRLTGFALVIQPGDQTCLNEQLQFSQYSFYGRNAFNLAYLTRGVTGSICDSNYSSSLKKIGDRVLNLVTEITLSHEPVSGTVEVSLIPEDPTVRWVVDGRKVEFNKPPIPGTRVDIQYVKKP